MRSLLALLTLLPGALAAPVDDLQFVLGHAADGIQASTGLPQHKPIVEADLNNPEEFPGVITTNKTIYTYLSQELR